jgi:hypothetical protein
MDAQDRIIYAQTGGGKRIGTAFDRITALRSGGTLADWCRDQARAIGFHFHGKVRGRANAEINHGRWIVRCGCGGAEEATWQDPVFFCLSCGSIDNDSYLKSVEFPPEGERKEIERFLLVRSIENRNWQPGESPSDLEAENREHGLDSA